MKKIKKSIYKARYMLGFVFALSLIVVAMLHHATEVHAAAWCSICGQDRYWNGTKYVVPATCTTKGYWCYRCEGCQQVGKTKYDIEIDPNAHNFSSTYTYGASNGIAEGVRYYACQNGCESKSGIQYACRVYEDVGIASVEGTNWYDAGATVIVDATPSSGYKWDHWGWTGDGSTTTKRYSFTINQAYNFFAYGVPSEHSIHYDANGGSGSMSDSTIAQSGGTLSANTFTRTGYSFAGWNTMANGSGTSYINEAMIYPSANTTLYAQWQANDYTITLDPNGGTCPTESVNPRYDQDWYYCVNSHTPARKGHTFKGWYDAIKGGTQVYKPDGYCTNEGTYFVNNIWKYTGDVTLYARWEVIPRTVTYHANGGTTGNQERINYYDDDVDLSLTAAKSGYIFVGWNTDPAARTGLSSLKVQEADITLYAIYSIEVSDIANHSYDENDDHLHGQEKEKEVFLRIWNTKDEKDLTDYALEYQYDVSTMVYRYKTTEPIDVTKYRNSGKPYAYAIYVYDNAGNWNVVDSGMIQGTTSPPPPPEEPDKYVQTVEHYRYECSIGEYVDFLTIQEEVEEGKTYTPAHLKDVVGYTKERMEYPKGVTIAGDGSYIVTQAQTTKVYYKPKVHTITFDANGGTTAETKRDIRYGELYGELPTPTRKGYTFMGWYTDRANGDKVESTDIYLIDDDSTLFAHWSINSYTVTYDYWTNGGTSVSTPQKAYDFGKAVDLSVTAGKAAPDLKNWTFVGWNMDATAIKGLDSFTMPDEDVTLYAIYTKKINITLIEQKNDTTTAKKTLSKNIYNTAEEAEFKIATSYSWDSWTLRGWTSATGAKENVMYENSETYDFAENVTLYALYMKSVTLTYDTNGATSGIKEPPKEAYHNAAGNSIYPIFVTAAKPELDDHTFVTWTVEEGVVHNEQGIQQSTCKPGVNIMVLEDARLTAYWDAHPKLEAYNRYFTLDQARDGYITEAELLRKVKATDEEAKSESNPEGTLRNGTDVIVVEYAANTFTSLTTDAEIYVTYEAKDAYGNIVTQTVTITVTDTKLVESPKKSYVRFISRQFLLDDSGNLIPESKGGLSETSTWRTNDNYRNLLINTLSNSNTDIETWVFTREDIAEIKKKL